ncbi:WXG100 family type VII secretion target [Nocardia mexicana]|uniref:WXG100 family type VII secretion target n=1 Tax=Nocardia mexicana TaxID=279262 RepID=A0A370GT25_9NOCA|nr:WXG100 family type VII secretion target [Nocardia mexicana]RDI46619.1 WXG100 family type VII secretion target [Nocardia mexicana]
MTEPEGPAPEFAIVPAEVTDAGQFVKYTADSLVSGLRSLDADIATLLEAWRGGSADVYGAGWEEVKQGAVTVLESLSSMAELLGVTSQVVQEMDDSRARAISTLNI